MRLAKIITAMKEEDAYWPPAIASENEVGYSDLPPYQGIDGAHRMAAFRIMYGDDIMVYAWIGIY